MLELRAALAAVGVELAAARLQAAMAARARALSAEPSATADAWTSTAGCNASCADAGTSTGSGFDGAPADVAAACAAAQSAAHAAVAGSPDGRACAGQQLRRAACAPQRAAHAATRAGLGGGAKPCTGPDPNPITRFRVPGGRGCGRRPAAGAIPLAVTAGPAVPAPPAPPTAGQATYAAEGCGASQGSKWCDAPEGVRSWVAGSAAPAALAPGAQGDGADDTLDPNPEADPSSGGMGGPIRRRRARQAGCAAPLQLGGPRAAPAQRRGVRASPPGSATPAPERTGVYTILHGWGLEAGAAQLGGAALTLEQGSLEPCQGAEAAEAAAAPPASAPGFEATEVRLLDMSIPCHSVNTFTQTCTSFHLFTFLRASQEPCDT